MCKAKKYSEQLLEIYNNIDKDYEYYYSEVGRFDAITQDLLHAIENGDFNVAEGYKLAKRIKDIRVERRIAKVEVKTLSNLKKTFCDKNIHQLKCAHGQIKKEDEILMKQIEEKVYKPKILESIDLKLLVPLNRKVI